MSPETRLAPRPVLFLLASALVLFATACGSGDEDPTATARPSASPTTIPAQQATATVAAQRTATAVAVHTAVSVAATTTATATAIGPTPQSSPVLARELILQGSFEGETFEHWQARLAGTQLIQATTARRVTGQKAIYMTNPPGETTSPNLTMKERFPAEAGSSYFVSFSAIQTFQGPAELVVEYFDGNGNSIGRESIVDRVDTADNWSVVSRIVVAPERSATARLEVRIRTWLDDGTARPDLLEVWVDDVSVRKVNE